MQRIDSKGNSQLFDVAEYDGDSKVCFPFVLPKVCNLPYLRNPNFVGRTKLLSEIYDFFVSEKNYSLIQVITGFGGYGKTQLAIEYIYRYSYIYRAVFWVRAENPMVLINDYASLAEELDLVDENNTDQSLAIKKVNTWLKRNDSWLMIFDNAPSLEELHDYIPLTFTGHILITSRKQNWFGLFNLIKIGVLQDEESINFLLKRTGIKDYKGASQLARELGNLPIALEYASAYIKTSCITFSSYLDLLNKNLSVLTEKQLSPIYRASISAAWEITFCKIKELSLLSVNLLYIFSFFSPDFIPRNLFVNLKYLINNSLESTQVVDIIEINSAIGLINDYSLISITTDTISIHRLIQLFIRCKIEDKEKGLWISKAFSLLKELFPDNINKIKNWRMCDQLFPHIMVISEYVDEYCLDHIKSEKNKLMEFVSLYSKKRSKMTQAIKAFNEGLSSLSDIKTETSITKNTWLYNLKNILERLEMIEDNNEHYEKSLSTIYKTYNGNLHVNNPENFPIEKPFENEILSQTQNDEQISVNDLDNAAIDKIVCNLGHVLKSMGNLLGAINLYKYAFSIIEEEGDNDNEDKIFHLTNIALTYEELNYNYEADKYFQLIEELSNEKGNDTDSYNIHHSVIITSREEETEFIRKARRGDISARNILVENNYKLVNHIVRRLSNGGKFDAISDELTSIGTIALIKAVNSYDLSNETKFSSYVSKIIESEILLYIRANKERLSDVSLYEHIGIDIQGDEIVLMDLIVPLVTEDDETINKIMYEWLNTRINELLSIKEREVIRLKYGFVDDCKTHKQIAKILGISPTTVSKIANTALRKLEKEMSCYKSDFL